MSVDVTAVTSIVELLDGLPRWSVAHDDRVAAGRDRSGLIPDGLPLAVVYASSADDVETLMRRAAGAGIAVVPRGAGTGLSGAATSSHGEVVLDVSGLDRIIEIDQVNRTARVQPGVITADLSRAAATHGLEYAPDPASAAISTIGGNIATNAGGLRCVKYGVTRDAVLELDVVLGDGRRLRTGHRTSKGVTGYDLTSLLVGSEGTLGIIVEATVRLIPAPVNAQTATASFATVSAAVDAVVDLLGQGLRPSVLEMLDHATLRALDEALGVDLSTRGEALLLIQTDGSSAVDELSRIIAVLTQRGAETEVASSPAEGEDLLSIRRQALPSIERQGRVLIEDIAVPIGNLAAAVAGIAEISDRTGVRIFTFAHAGDGNLHPIVLAGGDPAAPIATRVVDAVGEIFELALRLGGTLTGEHGVGTLKRPWLDAELDPVNRDVQRALKAVFDPAGILNPGKAI